MHEAAPEDCIGPTPFIESDAPPVRELAQRVAAGCSTPVEVAVALFDWVRDEVRYDPWTVTDPPSRYRATSVLERRRGYCIQKAVLLAALCRAVGIPARLGFADVRNHKTPRHMLDLMGTNLFAFHGFVELHLDGRWLKATPAFDGATSAKAGVLPVTLDGTKDAMFHPVDPEGHPFIEYVASRGSYADLPIEEIRRTLIEIYPRAAAALRDD